MKEINREQFEAWLFSQPPEREFDYSSIRECAMCAFIKETTNFKDVTASFVGWNINGEVSVSIPCPVWMDSGHSGVKAVVNVRPLTISNMQRCYRELFPEIDEPELAYQLLENVCA